VEKAVQSNVSMGSIDSVARESFRAGICFESACALSGRAVEFADTRRTKRATVPRNAKRKSDKRKLSGRTAARAKSAARGAGKMRHSGTQARSGKTAGELFKALVALQARLRAPGGCPWDREQTHESLRPYLVEETYEVLDALDSGRADKIAGELGDLLLQVVFHAELAREAGRFDIGEVIAQVHAKMVRRHPHVFGDARARTPGEVLKKWEQLKAEERRAEAAPGEGTDGASESILDGIARGLPALVEAQQISRRAANVGFDWQNVEGILEKLGEEIAELRQAMGASSDAARKSREVEDELGDLFFAMVNLARFLGFDSEIALKRASRKFKARFQMMERCAREEGRPLAEMSVEDLDRLWEEAKAQAVSA
jgi:MazG family protein